MNHTNPSQMLHVQQVDADSKDACVLGQDGQTLVPGVVVALHCAGSPAFDFVATMDPATALVFMGKLEQAVWKAVSPGRQPTGIGFEPPP